VPGRYQGERRPGAGRVGKGSATARAATRNMRGLNSLACSGLTLLFAQDNHIFIQTAIGTLKTQVASIELETAARMHLRF